MSSYTLVDVFAGAGGLSRGFAQTGEFKFLLAVEKDPDARKSYAANFHGGDVSHVLEDITAIDPAALNLHPDVLIGGPPCQDFTQLTAVRAELTRDRNELLWQHFIRWVIALRPRVFVMENVPNLLTDNQYEHRRKDLKDRLSREGYRVVWGVLTASNYGVPQSRQRAFVIGTNLGQTPGLPLPTLETKTAWSAIRDLGEVEPGVMPERRKLLNSRQLHIGRTIEALSRLRCRYVQPDGNRMHIPRPVTIKSWVDKTNGTSDGYGRVYAFRPSSTIRCEGFKPEKGRFLHPFADRPLTLLEMARIQSFPDEHVFYGSHTSIARQIGNAVPPKLAAHVAGAVLALLRGEMVTPVPPEPAAEEGSAVSGGSATRRVLRLLQRNVGKAVPWWEIQSAVLQKSASGVTDWGTPLRELVDDGYQVEAGPGEGLPLGYYRIRRHDRVPSEERPNVRRLIDFVLQKRPYCEACHETVDLTGRLVRLPEDGGLLVPDNVEVLCGQCRVAGGLSSDISRAEHKVLSWLAEFRSYPQVAGELASALGLGSGPLPEGPLPKQSNPGEVLVGALDEAKACALCNESKTPVFHAEFIRPLEAGGLAHRDNAWVLCPKCRADLEDQTIRVPTPGVPDGTKHKGLTVRLRERFSEPGFMTPSEAYYRNWLLLHGRDRAILGRARSAFITGTWEVNSSQPIGAGRGRRGSARV